VNAGAVASIVIATHNRPGGLRACLDALTQGPLHHPMEIVVVDDASTPPVDAVALEVGVPVRLLRGEGCGPAAARNRGIAAAAGDIVIFTDDDTRPEPGWADAAIDYLERHPHDIGVEGPVRSRPWDPLYEKSIATEVPGHHWTCNIAYRREVLTAVGGFNEGFPGAHGEDLDLAFRAKAHGTIGFSDAMAIDHAPRPVSVRDFVREGRAARSALMRSRIGTHPPSRPGPLGSARLRLLVWASRDAARLFMSALKSRNPRRVGRALVCASARWGATLVALVGPAAKVVAER
jgi:glycosyltransferase involved in cell wall biosynthesis